MYMYNWFSLLYILNNIVNQLYLVKKFLKEKNPCRVQKLTALKSEDFLESSDSGVHLYSVN